MLQGPMLCALKCFEGFLIEGMTYGLKLEQSWKSEAEEAAKLPP